MSSSPALQLVGSSRSGGSRLGYRCLAALLCCYGAFGICLPAAARPNVVIIMTDDQRFDTLDQMPTVIEKLASRGVRFSNAYVSTPLCGPSRASLFSGGYFAKNTGVLENELPNGGARLFNDDRNFGRVMQLAGYQTVYVGKWMNDHWGLGPDYVPPGWSRFVGRMSNVLGTDWSNNLKYVVGSSAANSTVGSRFTLYGQYLAYYERDQILKAIDQSKPGQPFLIFWSPAAPHLSATPAPGDEGLYPNYIYRGRGYGEADLSDKPQWVRSRKAIDIDDESVRDQLRSLRSVDRVVGAIVDKLTAIGQLNNTVILFTSDNGFQWGEHSFLWSKLYPYEESIRVPMVVFMPGVAPRVEWRLVSASLDIAPTLYQLAGVTRATEGNSLVPLLRNPAAIWRSELFFEGYETNTNGKALWAAVLNNKWKYIKYWTGEEELYDLAVDPFELRSRHDDPAVSSIKSSLATRTNQLLGLAIVPVRAFPVAKINTPYKFQFKTWGGVGPYRWKLESGRLPPGVTLNATTGVLGGAPSARGAFTFQVRVTDSSIAIQAQHQRTFVTGPLNLNVT